MPRRRPPPWPPPAESRVDTPASLTEARRTPTPGRGYRRGEPGYRRVTTALFAAGIATFVSMYSAQAVLPELADRFGVSPATSALAVSATTGMLACSIVPASILSERYGRTRVMFGSALASAVIGVLIPFAPSMGAVIAGRALQGVTLAGVPAVAMAYLAEEIDPDSLSSAMGRYVAGTTVGGLAGRVVASLTLDVTTWRWALEVAALVALIFTAAFARMAPASRFFEARPIGVRTSAAAIGSQLRNPRVMALVVLAFLLMGGFVSVYNLLGFRLLRPPFRLSEGVVGLVFLMYLAGTFTSAWAGRLAERFGRPAVLLGAIGTMGVGLLLTVPQSLPLVLAGVLLFTGGFFGAHSTASGWVSATVTEHRAEASSLYLFGYYTGSSALGALAGVPFARWGWNGAVAFVGALVLVAAGIATWRIRSTRRSRVTG